MIYSGFCFDIQVHVPARSSICINSGFFYIQVHVSARTSICTKTNCILKPLVNEFKIGDMVDVLL